MSSFQVLSQVREGPTGQEGMTVIGEERVHPDQVDISVLTSQSDPKAAREQAGQV